MSEGEGIFFAKGQNYLITSNSWFYAPDGQQYRAVWGTLQGVFDPEQTLGIKTNAKSTNWYVSIGNMVIAGCQIFHVIACDKVNFDNQKYHKWHDGELREQEAMGSIYNANQEL